MKRDPQTTSPLEAPAPVPEQTPVRGAEDSNRVAGVEELAAQAAAAAQRAADAQALEKQAEKLEIARLRQEARDMLDTACAIKNRAKSIRLRAALGGAIVGAVVTAIWTREKPTDKRFPRERSK